LENGHGRQASTRNSDRNSIAGSIGRGHEAPKWCCSSAARTAFFLQRLGRRVLPNIPLFPRVNQLCLCLREPLFGNAIESDGAPERMNVKNGYVIVMPIILR